MGRSRGRGIIALLLVVVTTSLAGCGPVDRPSVAEWRATWEEARATVPEASSLEDPPAAEECETVLGELRSQRPRLAPAPDDVVASASTAWIAYAEHVFFSCFGEGTPEDVTEAYETLDRLALEVEASLPAG